MHGLETLLQGLETTSLQGASHRTGRGRHAWLSRTTMRTGDNIVSRTGDNTTTRTGGRCQHDGKGIEVSKRVSYRREGCWG